MVKNLRVFSQDRSIDKKSVHNMVRSLTKEFNLDISLLSISFIASVKLKEINQQFLHHNYETDIITFNYSKKQKVIDGEILISFEDAKFNAKKFNVNYSIELSRLVIHGILHLLNFDDTDTASKKIMKKEENRLINKFNFALLVCK